ncbi:hypothetical protein Rsub_12696 [Raphidocelis subcapitata]|uniref:Uncharacterized protein n=1 Tax=Raphidocelis subcapitata TaxID=307507 RepID=A0A2V0PPD7_9CHLO|nr:hypothetical protein Rsub_12696 [Raphidocelis subcapitata]|eukprot:GBF99900.1 hypothetical protein Rsub_12696 [Raphidocelis subcapitata]
MLPAAAIEMPEAVAGEMAPTAAADGVARAAAGAGAVDDHDQPQAKHEQQQPADGEQLADAEEQEQEEQEQDGGSPPPPEPRRTGLRARVVSGAARVGAALDPRKLPARLHRLSEDVMSREMFNPLLTRGGEIVQEVRVEADSGAPPLAAAAAVARRRVRALAASDAPKFFLVAAASASAACAAVGVAKAVLRAVARPIRLGPLRAGPPVNAITGLMPTGVYGALLAGYFLVHGAQAALERQRDEGRDGSGRRRGAGEQEAVLRQARGRLRDVRSGDHPQQRQRPGPAGPPPALAVAAALQRGASGGVAAAAAALLQQRGGLPGAPAADAAPLPLPGTVANAAAQWRRRSLGAGGGDGAGPERRASADSSVYGSPVPRDMVFNPRIANGTGGCRITLKAASADEGGAGGARRVSAGGASDGSAGSPRGGEGAGAGDATALVLNGGDDRKAAAADWRAAAPAPARA